MALRTGALAKPADFEAIVVRAAHSLALRYSPVVGMVRSWGARDDASAFLVIVDNLMNLELLLWCAAAAHASHADIPPPRARHSTGPSTPNAATSLSRSISPQPSCSQPISSRATPPRRRASERSANASLAHLAASHAERTIDHFLRADGSTAHLCTFDPASGALRPPCTGTPQGFGPNSTWARGQAWAIYGFTMVARYLSRSADPELVARAPLLLAAAQRAAAYFVANAGAELIPPWDFHFTNSSSPQVPAASRLESSTPCMHVLALTRRWRLG